jgi:hypothetical protein
MSWLEAEPDERFALKVAWRRSGQWSPPVTVVRSDRFFVNWADFPSVRGLDDDRVAVHWLQRSPSAGHAYDIMVALGVADGASWSPPSRPHRDSGPAEHGFASLVPLAGGRLGVVWLDGRERVEASAGAGPSGSEVRGHTKLMYAPYDLRKAEFGPETVIDESVCDCCSTAGVATEEGMLVAYRDRSPDEVRDIGAVRLVGQEWSEPLVVANDGWRLEACPVNGPAAAARQGNVVVVWFTGAGDEPRVRAAFSSDRGASFGEPARIDMGRPSGRVDVAFVADDEVVVSWLEAGEGSVAELRARRLHLSGAVGPPALVAQVHGSPGGGFPRLAADGDLVYLAWSDAGPPSHVRLAQAPIRMQGP